MIVREGIELIKRFEGCKLTAYKDIKGIWTIGYGHTIGVHPNMWITQEEADSLLYNQIELLESAIKKRVSCAPNPYQLAALVSFTYNVGLGHFESSTLLKKLNATDYVGASNEFLRWNQANKKVIAGLTARREAERELFLKQQTTTT